MDSFGNRTLMQHGKHSFPLSKEKTATRPPTKRRPGAQSVSRAKKETLCAWVPVCVKAAAPPPAWDKARGTSCNNTTKKVERERDGSVNPKIGPPLGHTVFRENGALACGLA